MHLVYLVTFKLFVMLICDVSVYHYTYLNSHGVTNDTFVLFLLTKALEPNPQKCACVPVTPLHRVRQQ